MVALLVMMNGMHATAQVAYPDLTVQNVSWASGTHHYGVTQRILSPATPELPVNISGTADAEFVSGTQVRLTPGFHAGAFSSNGRFHARIDASLGAPGDVVIIAPDPDMNIVDNMIHVPKWEKVEIGVRLPQVYQAAVDSFFTHYYSNGPLQDATPGNVDSVHDLNPYADDSLQLVMTLTKPDGQRFMRWGFFMREAMWNSTDDTAILAEDTADIHYPYTIRFRIAPDTVGTWLFALSIKAPQTVSVDNTTLPHLSISGYTFICDPPLPENHGFLEVNKINRRNLRFNDGTPFLGLGTNMADWRRNYWDEAVIRRRDFNAMFESMSLLHEAGGNFLRMYLMDKLFAPEYVNLGVYDAYRIPMVCSLSESTNDPNCDRGWTTGATNNCQYQAWAFDQMLDQARINNIYLQLCIDPYTFGTAFEKGGSGAHAYVINFLDTLTRAANGTFDVKELFYKGGNPSNKTTGVFTYWKRKYKYILARWGYSVNLAVLEPFNEIDNLLTYQAADLTSAVGSVAQFEPASLDLISHRDMCRENRVDWPADPLMPNTIYNWFTDIAKYVRDDQDPDNPATSPLSDKRQLFLASYAGGEPNMPGANTYYKPFTNPEVDLIDAHTYSHPSISQQNTPDANMLHAFNRASLFRTYFPSSNLSIPRKPYIHGEMCSMTYMTYGNWEGELEKIFHNYDVSFHNEIWASAFSGNFATGLTWHWERVFWWKDALNLPPPDLSSQVFIDNHPSGQFSVQENVTNYIDIGGNAVPITNRRLEHQFKPLADLLSHPSWTALDFFDSLYTAHLVYDTYGYDETECYFLKNASNTVAIGWVHNRNAWTMKNFYLTSTVQNFLGCAPPDSSRIRLSGFATGTPYHITWFPTRNDTSAVPPSVIDSSGTGTVTLDLTGYWGGTANNYLDTLRSDHAFIITPSPFVKSLMITHNDDTPLVDPGWDFTVYPNPTRDALFLRFSNGTSKEITLIDGTGRPVITQSNITATDHYLPLDQLAKGVYLIRVVEGTNAKGKRVIIH